MIDRRALIQSAAGSALGATVADRSAAAEPPSATVPSAAPVARVETHVTEQFVKFARELRYEELPDAVRHAAKRYLLDSLGCAVAGHLTDKGTKAVHVASSLGGNGEARILGSGQRVCATNAAFANGELTNALDFDAIPHIPPFVVPPILAMAERTGASGKSLILAIVIAHEISARLGSASGQRGSTRVGEIVKTWGIGNESIVGAAAGIASLLALDNEKTAYAIGLAGYYCPPPTSHHFETISPLSMVKYSPAGWICQGSVTAALLAQAGFTASPSVFDGPVGFPVFFHWEDGWRPELATARLGEHWRILNVDFKAYACCRLIHSQLDCLTDLIAKHGFKPDQIQHIDSLGLPLVANPDKMNVRTQIDAQFSTPYMLAVAACGFAIDATDQSPARLSDPTIRRMMSKITWGTHPDAAIAQKNDPKSYIARVEVTVDGQVFREERMYASGTDSAGMALSDDELSQKFIGNATTLLPRATSSKALDLIWQVESHEYVSPMVDSLCT